jgi:hypothetical protein
MDSSEKCVGMRNLMISELAEPDDEFKAYRVRPINKKRVSQIADSINPEQIFIVVCIQQSYVVIDGNHRLMALKTLIETGKTPGNLRVPCLVYENLAVTEAIGLGFRKNTEDSDSMRMTDLEKINIIRTIYTDMNKQTKHGKNHVQSSVCPS